MGRGKTWWSHCSCHHLRVQSGRRGTEKYYCYTLERVRADATTHIYHSLAGLHGAGTAVKHSNKGAAQAASATHGRTRKTMQEQQAAAVSEARAVGA